MLMLRGWNACLCKSMQTAVSTTWNNIQWGKKLMSLCPLCEFSHPCSARRDRESWQKQKQWRSHKNLDFPILSVLVISTSLSLNISQNYVMSKPLSWDGKSPAQCSYTHLGVRPDQWDFPSSWCWPLVAIKSRDCDQSTVCYKRSSVFIRSLIIYKLTVNDYLSICTVTKPQ